MSEPVPSADAKGSSSRAPAPWPRWSSDLHESLASQEASAAELRHDLDDLRRTLDAAPARTPAPRTGPLRSPPLLAAGAGVLLALAAAAVATGYARSGSPPSSGTRATTTATPTSAARTASSGSTAARTATSGPTPAAPPLPAWPGQSAIEPPNLPAHGVGADASGTELTAALSANRSVDVYERAVLLHGATTLALRPAGSLDLSRSLQAPLPAVEDLHAEADGLPVRVTRTASGWTVAAPSGTTVSRLVLRYRLGGALVRSEPAPPGRYTLVLTPLAPSAGGGAGDAVVVRIRDPRIEEVYCPGATDPLCGRVDGPLHTATVPRGAVPVVIALVTFPT